MCRPLFTLLGVVLLGLPSSHLGAQATKQVNSLIATGTLYFRNSAVATGQPDAYGEHPTEIRVIFPDAYVQVDTRINGLAIVRGMVGTRIVSPTARFGVAYQVELTRLGLLWFDRIDTIRPLTRAGANAINDPDLGVIAVTRASPQGPPTALRWTERKSSAATGRPTGDVLGEATLTIVSRRTVDGVSVPDRIIRHLNGAVHSEWRFTSIRVNPAGLTRANIADVP